MTERLGLFQVPRYQAEYALKSDELPHVPKGFRPTKTPISTLIPIVASAPLACLPSSTGSSRFLPGKPRWKASLDEYCVEPIK
ncbi:hypothetical protein [Rhizobium calliandrae]|uniref:hypothetical protein n=1 Tax=Rhizobium calliandrae TaxID=1312182 RepID=UPI003D80A490